jgi:hypothetical protein
MTEPTLPRVAQNPITGIGVFVTTVSAVLFLVFTGAEVLGLAGANPYLGVVFLLVMPGLFLLGLALIPLGIARERRRRARGAGPSLWHWPRLDMNNPVHRRRVAIVGVLTIVNVVIVAVAAYRGVAYMDSVPFCGTVCHAVMEPEYTAYQDGPHARVACVECHIGPGAPWFVKAKVDGLRQVWAVAFGTYERPVPTPVHDLRPARDTCEHCHWPEKFTGDLVRTLRTYKDDAANAESASRLLMRVGGGGQRFGGPHGIHWHTSRDHKVEYIATDAERQVIPWVRLTDGEGRVTEFAVAGVGPEVLARGQLRTMDCVDCHNRPSHRFAPSPERAVDGALAAGLLPRDLPWVRREAVAALKATYADSAAAARGIAARLQGFYEKEHPDLVRNGDPRIARAVAAVQRLHGDNVFPRMNVTWGTHPDHIGHETSPGCFRCHDEEHKAPDGRAIRQDCELCHLMQE